MSTENKQEKLSNDTADRIGQLIAGVVGLIFIGFMVRSYLAAPGPPVDPNPAIADVADETTRIEVYAGYRNDKDRRVAVFVDQDDIDEFVSLLKAVPQSRDGHAACACHGSCQVYFYDDDDQIAHMGIHHGERVSLTFGRWQGSQFILESDVRPALRAYLAELGIPEYEDYVTESHDNNASRPGAIRILISE